MHRDTIMETAWSYSVLKGELLETQTQQNSASIVWLMADGISLSVNVWVRHTSIDIGIACLIPLLWGLLD